MVSDTPRTDAIRNTPLMGETVTAWKWDMMTEHARRLERDRAELIHAVEDLIPLADEAMRIANSDGGEFSRSDELAPARALLERMK